ncbi:MAG: hypothetical protein AB9891_08665 [Anaerolineaceae bacterium]
MKISFIYPENEIFWDSNSRRCVGPARAINRTGRHSAALISHTEFINPQPYNTRILEQSDILVIHRNLWGRTQTKIHHWQARGKTVIGDFEDAYQLFTPEALRQIYCEENNISTSEVSDEKNAPPLLTQFKWGLQLVNAATVPSMRLADEWQAYKRIEIVPDYIDLERYQDKIPQEHQGVILGWCGRISQVDCLEKSGLLPALQEVCRSRPEVSVMICVDQPEEIEDLGIPSDQLILKQRNVISNWPDPLTLMDIGLIPSGGIYDQRGGAGTVLEYLVMKIPWIASIGHVLHEQRLFGWQVENLPEAWQRILIEMVDHIDDYRLEASLTPYLYGLAQSLDENIFHTIETYAKIAGFISNHIPEDPVSNSTKI